MPTYISKQQQSYQLLDSGEGMKLERFGSFTLARPDPEALWQKRLSKKDWDKADASYERAGTTGAWKKNTQFPKAWTIDYGGLVLELRPSSFKHVGVFPEQIVHWQWMENKIQEQREERKEAIRVLNLFAYTGGASLIAARAGAEVVHVDSSKVAIEWARKNAELSGLADKPIRWLEDDVLTFLRREVKRGNTYDVIVMDPPAFGHGKGDKLWKIEKDFYELFELVQKVLSPEPVAIILNGYTAGYSSITLANNMQALVETYGGTVESGELALAEEGSTRLLPAGVFARWSK